MYILPYDKFSVLTKSCGIEVTKEQYELFDKFSGLLLEYNKVMNLTGITDAAGISEKHLLDSLLIFRYADISKNSNVIDVGTGAGFPGVPMKIYRPDLNVTLLDSLQKRVNFLENVSRGTFSMKCIHSRAEDAGRDPEFREKYDHAIARAVAAMPVLAEYCLPFVKVGGSFIAMKGPSENIMEGESAVKALGGEITSIQKYGLPCGDGRVMVIVKKILPAPTKYPRNSARISKKSL